MQRLSTAALAPTHKCRAAAAAAGAGGVEPAPDCGGEAKEAAGAVHRDLRRPHRAVAMHPLQLAILDLDRHEGTEARDAEALAQRAAAARDVLGVGAVACV